MDIDALTFDPDGLRAWVECESPTWDAGAVNRMMDVASHALLLAGAGVERIPGRGGFGDCLRARFPHPAPMVPGILLLGHLDTVHPVGTLARQPFRRDGDRLFGPGCYDMKAGIYVALAAIGQMQRAGCGTKLPVTVLLTSDEEAGSPSTRDLIEAEAMRHRAVLLAEPARADGGVVTGRGAVTRFTVTVSIPPGQPGSHPQSRSAIREMARKILEIEVMSTEACSFSVGVVQGGQWANCIPATCTAEVLSMARTQPDLERGVARMLALSATTADSRVVVTRGVTRPVWQPDSGTMALYETARQVARGLGGDLTQDSAEGGSDGNFTGALGIPTLDGLGVQGGGAHAPDEHVLVSSLAQRGRLIAGLLMTLGG